MGCDEKTEFLVNLGLGHMILNITSIHLTVKSKAMSVKIFLDVTEGNY